MFQNNQENIIRFLNELGEEIYDILENGKLHINTCEEFLHMYRPKTQEEVGEFCRVRFELPDSAGLLCGIQKIEMPENVEFYDLIAPLRDLANDVVFHMVSAEVLINDIINMHIDPYDNEMYILQYLTTLKTQNNYIIYLRDKLDTLYKEKIQVWPELLISEDDDKDEDTILPGEVESFQYLRSVIDDAFKKYIKENKSELISKFLSAIKDYLELFENGAEPENEFNFSFSLESGDDDNHEIRYVDFNFESGLIEVSSGGSVYDEYVGSDSYTNRMYSIWLNGWDEGDYGYDFSEILGLIRAGAELRIEYPEEFNNCEEEE